jgi:hypothetical protein
MADTKLSALTELAAAPASDDELYIRDVSEAAAAESKRITVANMLGSVAKNPLTADLDFAEYKAIALVCDTGATVPASPTAGQWFRHAPTGRNILMIYNGTAWALIMSIGTCVIYVDNTDGTDSIDKGGEVDAGAVKTVQYAVNLIPGLVSGNVIININAETYAETVTVQGKSVTGNYTITLQGTLSTLDSLHAEAGCAQGGAGTQGTVVDDAGTFTGTNSRQNKLVRFTSGVCSGETRVIDSNSTTTLTIVGMFTGGTPAHNDTYVVENWGTIVSAISINSLLTPIIIKNIQFTGANTALFVGNCANVAITSCSLTTGWINSRISNITLTTCACIVNLSGLFACLCDLGGTVTLEMSKFANSHDAGFVIYTANMVGMSLNGCVIDGTAGANKASYGIWIISGAVVFLTTTGASYNVIHHCDTGIAANTGGQAINTAYVTYSTNGTNETATAASYGYID